MNIQNLMSQLGNSSNPLQMMMNMLNPSQKQMANQFQNKTTQEKAEAIADYCNKNNISKEQFTNIVNMFNKK